MGPLTSAPSPSILIPCQSLCLRHNNNQRLVRCTLCQHTSHTAEAQSSPHSGREDSDVSPMLERRKPRHHKVSFAKTERLLRMRAGIWTQTIYPKASVLTLASQCSLPGNPQVLLIIVPSQATWNSSADLLNMGSEPDHVSAYFHGPCHILASCRPTPQPSG